MTEPATNIQHLENKRTTWARRLAIATAVGMFIVLLMGARVTATGSGDGCGNDWPLCNGSWMPGTTYKTLTEYSHRLVTGVEGFLVLGTTILAWPLRKRYREFTILVPAMAGTLVLQSLMGAAAVKWPTSAEIMATHFGISLICLASAALVAFILIEDRRGARRLIASTTNLTGFRWFVIAIFLFSILTAYSGAYVRHTDAELACTSWPTCNGSLTNVDLSHTPQGIQTIHRVMAGLISLMVLGLAWWTYRLRAIRPDLQILGGLALLVVIAQGIVGRIVIYSGLELMATLSHAGLMAIFFVLLSEGVRRTWPVREVRSTERFSVGAPKPVPGD